MARNSAINALPQIPLVLSTDEFKSAIAITSAVYGSIARRLILRNGAGEMTEDRLTGITESLQRMKMMDQLLNDDNLCEMLAGHVAQLQHGTRVARRQPK